VIEFLVTWYGRSVLIATLLDNSPKGASIPFWLSIVAMYCGLVETSEIPVAVSIYAYRFLPDSDASTMLDAKIATRANVSVAENTNERFISLMFSGFFDIQNPESSTPRLLVASSFRK
jgi:hypothetical protein